MPYLLITIVAGTLMAALSAWSLVRCIQDGGVFVNQLRFFVSGILLALFFPLHGLATDAVFDFIEPLGAGEDSYTLAYWAAVAAYVTVQVAILPTQRELYSTYLADRFTRATER